MESWSVLYWVLFKARSIHYLEKTCYIISSKDFAQSAGNVVALWEFTHDLALTSRYLVQQPVSNAIEKQQFIRKFTSIII
jgi:hypothetical protein